MAAENGQLSSYEDSIRRERRQQADPNQLRINNELRYHHGMLKLQIESAHLALQLHAAPGFAATASYSAAVRSPSTLPSTVTIANLTAPSATASNGNPPTKGESFPTPQQYRNIDPAYFDQFDQGLQSWAGDGWRPECDLSDLPKSELEKAVWVTLLRDSMFDFTDVVDKTSGKAKADNGVLIGAVPLKEFHMAAKAVMNACLALYRIGKQSNGMADPTKDSNGVVDDDERNMTFTERMKALCLLFKHSKKAVLDAVKQDVHLEYSCVLAPNLALKKKCDQRDAYDKRREAEKKREAEKLLEASKANDQQVETGWKQASKKRSRNTVDHFEGHKGHEQGEDEDHAEQQPKRTRRVVSASINHDSEELRRSKNGRILRSALR